MSVRVTLNCKIKPGKLHALLPFLEKNLPNVRGFKGSLKVSVLLDKESNEMLLDEEWLSVENHRAYLKFIDENGVLGKLSAFLITSPQIKYFEKYEV